MAIEDFIRIRGDVLDTAPLQGIGSDASDGGIGGTSGQADFSGVTTALNGIRDALGQESLSDWMNLKLWNAQTTAIEKESAYLRQLDNLYKEKHRILSENQSAILEFFEDVLSQFVGSLAGGIAIGAGAPQAAPAVSLIVGVLSEVGIGMVFDKLEKMLTDGSELIAAMIAENDILVTISSEDRTVGDYDRRAEIQARHIEQIKLIMSEITAAEGQLRQSLQVDEMQIRGFDQLTDDFRKAFLVENDDETVEGFLNERLKDLAYVDVKSDYGNFALYLKGKMLEF